MLGHFNYAAESGISKVVSVQSSGQYQELMFLGCGENTNMTVILLLLPLCCILLHVCNESCCRRLLRSRACKSATTERPFHFFLVTSFSLACLTLDFGVFEIWDCQVFIPVRSHRAELIDIEGLQRSFIAACTDLPALLGLTLVKTDYSH